MIGSFCVSVLRASSSSVPDSKMFVICISLAPILHIIEFSEERDIAQSIQIAQCAIQIVQNAQYFVSLCCTGLAEL